ncbi:hypothetical protein LguiA_006056 [Lonicera macranthoides]
MEKSGNQGKAVGEENKGKLEGLPTESSPYTHYKDVEDYKQQGYGTQGHLQPQPGRGAGATDAPTPSATDTVNRQGVP